jgi:hypothetical protein
MWQRLRLVTLAAVLSVAGCDKGGPGSNNLSTPKSAVTSYADAMRRGDVAAAKATVTGVNSETIDVLASSVTSRKRLDAAAVAKFGDDAKAFSGQNRSGAPEVEKWVADAEVVENGDTATVTPKDHSQRGVSLKKIDGQWKIDLSATPGMDQMSTMLPMLQKMNAANDELASEIAAGKYPTAKEAKAAQAQKMMASVVGAAGAGQ